ncbi:protein VASP homolog [Ixodes scapularis]|uniref:protein VASP homolog n=1 Tax=Ixodes scapularis TaxID=6945 RepID=UPI001A9E6A0B|nr:protein VASP homolog [Ixodes scapularis]
MPPLVATEPFPLPPGVLFPPYPSPPPPQLHPHPFNVPSQLGSNTVFMPVPVPMPLPMPPPPPQAPTIIACPPAPVQYSYPPPPPPAQPLSPSQDFARLIMLLERFGPDGSGGRQREEFESDMDRGKSRKNEKRENKMQRRKGKKERDVETKRGNGEDVKNPGVVLQQMQGDNQKEDAKKEELEEANKDSKGAHDLNAPVPGLASQAADVEPGAPRGDAQPSMPGQENGEPALQGGQSGNIGSPSASAPPQL